MTLRGLLLQEEIVLSLKVNTVPGFEYTKGSFSTIVYVQVSCSSELSIEKNVLVPLVLLPEVSATNLRTRLTVKLSIFCIHPQS